MAHGPWPCHMHHERVAVNAQHDAWQDPKMSNAKGAIPLTTHACIAHGQQKGLWAFELQVGVPQLSVACHAMPCCCAQCVDSRVPLPDVSLRRLLHHCGALCLHACATV